jgi:hypothetical protein
LTPDDWNCLEDIYNALKPFDRATKSLQSSATTGRYGSIWEWLPTVEYLLRHLESVLESWQAKYGKDNAMAVAAQNAWQKLNKWYISTDEAYTIYAASTLLSPRCKKHYFDTNWKKNEVEEMVEQVHKYWLQNYKSQQGSSKKASTGDDDPSPLESMLGAHIQKVTHTDAFLNYIHSPPIQGNVDILNWWLTTGPIELRQFALDVISIPAMSAEAERVFSSAKKLLTPERNALTTEALEVLECLRNWWMGDIILQRGGDDEVSDDEVSDDEVGDDEA